MILYSVLILAITLIENEAKSKKHFDRVSAITSQDAIHTAAELAKLINLVNGDVVTVDGANEDGAKEDGAKEDGASNEDENEYEVVGDSRAADSSNKPIDPDYSMIKNGDNNHQSVLKRITALIQSNYDAQKVHENPGLRIHVISNPRVLEDYKKNIGLRLVINNPRVLEEYKKKIRKKSHEKTDKRINFKDFMLDLRRNAVFRLDSSSVETSFKSRNNDDFKMTKNIPNSSENDQLVYFNTKKSFNDGQKKVGRIINDANKDKGRNNNYFDDDRKNIKKEGREFDDLKQDNAWDVITKKYDWEDNERKRKNKYNDDSPKYNKKDNIKKFKKDNRDIDDDLNKKITKPEKSYDDWPKNDKFIDKPKKKKWDSGEKKQDNFDDWDKSTNKKDNIKKLKKENRDIDEEWNKKIKKSEIPYEDWPKKEKFIDKPKTKKWDSGERQKPKKKTKDFDLSYEKPNKKEIKSFDSYEMLKKVKKSNNDWDNTPYKIASYKTTKKRQKESEVDWDKAYAPKIPSYYNPKPKSRNSYDGGGFFGRTPIPFVGKKGIYVENN